MVGVTLAKAIEVAKRPTAPGEDRLIVVPHHGDVAMWLGEKSQQLELRVVRVLELVDQDVAETVPQARRGGGVVAEQLERQRDLIAEVDDAMSILYARVGLVRRRELLVRRCLVRLHVGVEGISDGIAEALRVRDIRLRRNVLVARTSEEIEQGAHVLQRIARGSVPLERKGDLALRAAVEVLADHDHLLCGREDAELATSPKLERELAEDLIAESMERANHCVVQPDRRVDVDALLHLGRGAFGERDGEDLVRLGRARSDEVNDPRGEDMGLPCPGARDHKERAGPMLDGKPLFRLEPLKNVRTRLAKTETQLLCHLGRSRTTGSARPKPSLRGGGPPGLRPVPHRAGALGRAEPGLAR